MYYGFSEVGPMTKEAEDKCQEKKYSYYNVESFLKHLSGQVLTIIEATQSDQEQRKATKDIVKKFFSDAMLNVYELTVDCSKGGTSSSK